MRSRLPEADQQQLATARSICRDAMENAELSRAGCSSSKAARLHQVEPVHAHNNDVEDQVEAVSDWEAKTARSGRHKTLMIKNAGAAPHTKRSRASGLTQLSNFELRSRALSLLDSQTSPSTNNELVPPLRSSSDISTLAGPVL